MKDYDVAVVGGGISGCATAWFLAGEGARVALLEQHDINTQASGRNAGSLHGQIQFSPFVERGEGWARGFTPSLQFLAQSLDMWNTLGTLVGADLEVSTAGGILVADSPEQMRAIERKVAIEQAAGISSEVVSASELRERAPYLSRNIMGGEWCPIEGKANPLLATPALARAAVNEGAEIFSSTRVHHVERLDGKLRLATNAGAFSAERVVLAAGNGLSAFSSLLHAPIEFMDEPVQVTATEPAAHFVDHLVYYAGDKLTLKQAKAGTVLIGGGWPARTDDMTGHPTVHPRSLRSNLEVARRVVPAVGRLRAIRTWVGTGLATRDLAPVIGTLRDPDMILGVYPHMGFTAGPLLGRVLADLAQGRTPQIDLTPFTPTRF